MRRLQALAAAVLGLALFAGAAPAAASAQASAARTGTPAGALSTVLVVDTSGSMKGRNLAAARSSVSAYLSTLPSEVEVGVVTFSTRSKIVLDPTSDHAAVNRTLAALRPGGGTSLYDAVLSALRIADSADASRIVVVTDGEDTTSQATLDSAVKAVRASDTPLDTVDVRPGDKTGPALRRLAAAGQGRVVTGDNTEQLAALMAALTKVSEPPPTVALDDGGFASLSARELQIALGLCFVGLLTLLGLLIHNFSRSGRKQARAIRMVEAYGAGAIHRKTGEDKTLYDRSPVMGGALALATRIATHKSVAAKLGILLARAGLGLRPAEWVIVQFSVSVGFVVLLVLVLPNAVLGFLSGVVLGLIASHGWLVFKAGRRAKAFSDRLPDSLQLLAGGLATGFGLAQAVDAVAERGPQPVAEEFSRALAESRLGADLEDALDRVAERMASRDLELTVMSIRIQREVGGNLAEVLRSTVTTMRERAYLRRQVQGLSAEGRLSSYILIALPIGMTIFLAMFRGDYLKPMYSDPIGMILSGGAIVSVSLGAWMMRKMVKVDV